LKKDKEAPVISIKRSILDDKIVKAAVKCGVNLKESTMVVDTSFDTDTGIWKIKCVDSIENKELAPYRARMLIVADGSSSAFARKKGYIKTEASAICSRSFITADFNFQWDGVIFYPKSILPGYASILRHTNNELSYCVYIREGNPKCKIENLEEIHYKLLEEDPYISKSIGPKANPQVVIEKMKSASLRTGGLKANEISYDDHLIIIGDAAGFIDPLSGEGIQYAMESANIGAKIIREGLKNKNLSATFLKQYQGNFS
jgi:menaquinone-9 beta-reductase